MQQPVAPLVQSSQEAAVILTNAAIIRIVKAQVPNDVILTTIDRSEPSFALDTDGLVELKQAGVPDTIIRAMVAKAADLPASTRPLPRTTQQPAQSPVPTQVQPPPYRTPGRVGATMHNSDAIRMVPS
jgi:hypothetical protein